jgi:hypothetical protein
MQSKLTLRMDDQLIHRAKKIAAKKGKSVSQMVSDYVAGLEENNFDKTELTPLVKSLKGVLQGKKVDRGDYLRYLEEKYR